MNTNNGYSNAGAAEALHQLIPDLSSAQIADALRKWSWGIIPYPETFPVVVSTVMGQITNVSIQIDGGNALLVESISAIEVGTNNDSLINSISVNNTTNLIGSNPLPIKMITQYTGLPVKFPIGCPANSTITLQVQCGSTSNNSTIYITLWASRVPVNVVEDVKRHYGIN